MANTQEEVRDKTVALVIKVGKTGGKLTADILKWAMRKYLERRQNPHGRQTVKKLVRQNDGVKNIEITDKNIKSFKTAARKYGVSYALKKDPAAGKYLVFFKARDEAAITAAFSEYADKADKTIQRKREGREAPSIRAQLRENAEKLKHQERAVEQHLNKGGIEL